MGLGDLKYFLRGCYVAITVVSECFMHAEGDIPKYTSSLAIREYGSTLYVGLSRFPHRVIFAVTR